MTNGEKLKIDLGLSKFTSVKIARVVVGGSLKLYSIVFNSRKPEVPITTFQMRNDPRIVNFVQLHFGLPKRRLLTPYIDIELFQGTVDTSVFIMTDIAGYFKDKNTYDFYIPESYTGRISRLSEYLSLKDLKARMGQPDFNKKWEKERAKLNGTGNRNIKLKGLEFDGTDPIFRFETPVTDKYKNKTPKRVDPSTLSIMDNTSGIYELKIKILDFKKWLDTNPGLKKIELKDITDILDVSNIQIWSDSPSFQFQGYNANLTVMDASLHPEYRLATSGPNGWLDRTTDMGFTDKHLTQLFVNIEFFKQQMARLLNSKAKQKGLI